MPMSFIEVPVLPQKNVEKIESIISGNHIDTIIEYGSGNSTIYFIEKYKSQNIKFISVENSKNWFYKHIKTIKSRFQCDKNSINRSFWSARDYELFYSAKQHPYTPIQEGKSRVEKWQRVMDLGPFFRFEPDSGSRLQGKLKILRPVFKVINKLLRKLPRYCNENTQWKSKIQNCHFFYELVSPSMKDQFGESPNRDAYVRAGLKSIDSSDTNILIMIDAGPRHYIVDEVIRLLNQKNVHICLFDAHRPEYNEILNKYSGTFYSGCINLMDGTEFYKSIYPNDTKRSFILDHELWYYFSPSFKK